MAMLFHDPLPALHLARCPGRCPTWDSVEADLAQPHASGVAQLGDYHLLLHTAAAPLQACPLSGKMS